MPAPTCKASWLNTTVAGVLRFRAQRIYLINPTYGVVSTTPFHGVGDFSNILIVSLSFARFFQPSGVAEMAMEI